MIAKLLADEMFSEYEKDDISPPAATDLKTPDPPVGRRERQSLCERDVRDKRDREQERQRLRGH